MEDPTDHASAIIAAVQENDLAKVQTLLDTRDKKLPNPEDPSTHHRMQTHQPALNLALKLGRVEIAEFLLDHGHHITPGEYSILEEKTAQANPRKEPLWPRLLVSQESQAGTLSRTTCYSRQAGTSTNLLDTSEMH